MLFGLLVEARGFLPLAPAFVVRRQTPITVVEVQVNFGLWLSSVTQAHDPEHSVSDDEVTAQFPRPIVGMRGRSCSQGSTCRSNTPTSLLNHADDPRPSDRLADGTGDTPEICSMTCPTCDGNTPRQPSRSPATNPQMARSRRATTARVAPSQASSVTGLAALAAQLLAIERDMRLLELEERALGARGDEGDDG